MAASVDEVLEYWQAELRRHGPGSNNLVAAINLSGLLCTLERYPEAIAILDGVTLVQPSPELMTLWLNNRAYGLAMLGRAEEAIPLLDDADLLVDDRTPVGVLVTGCVKGTRGIALLHLGQLDEAQRLLLCALDVGRDAVARENRRTGPVAQGERALTAERWYWLAEIARRQDRPIEARKRLETAAAAEGRFAARAAASLK